MVHSLKKTSFEYRWLEALRDALQRGDINAFKWSFNVSVRDDPEVTIDMDRAFMLEFINDNRNKPWLKRRELEELNSDPSVLDMINAIQPLMGPLQKKLDKVMYSNVAEDVATIRDLISVSRECAACTSWKAVLASPAVSWLRLNHLLHRGCCTSLTHLRPMTSRASWSRYRHRGGG